MSRPGDDLAVPPGPGLPDGLVLPADIVGEDLVRAMARTPASEYVLVEQDGTVYGLLSTADVDAAFEAGARR